MPVPEAHHLTPSQRSWPWSIVVATLVVAALIILSALVNPLLGRYVHWDRIFIGGPVALLGLSVALRRRWL